jgi:hypothetical protein
MEQARDTLLALQCEVSDLRTSLHSMPGHEQPQNAAAVHTDGAGCDKTPATGDDYKLQQRIDSGCTLSAVAEDALGRPNSEVQLLKAHSQSHTFLVGSDIGQVAQLSISTGPSSALKSDLLTSGGTCAEQVFTEAQEVLGPHDVHPCVHRTASGCPQQDIVLPAGPQQKSPTAACDVQETLATGHVFGNHERCEASIRAEPAFPPPSSVDIDTGQFIERQSGVHGAAAAQSKIPRPCGPGAAPDPASC